MLLSTQLFDRIAGTPDLRSPEPERKQTVLPVGCRRAPEMRAANRFTFGQRAVICRDNGPRAGIRETVMMKDISLKGISFMSHNEMVIGDTFMLKLPDRQGQSVRIRCAVRRCEAGGIGGVAFRLGATFEQVIEQHSVRLNDEDGPAGSLDWQSETPAGNRAEAISCASVARVAMSLLKAVDPMNWMRKQDDYSSVS